MELRSSILAVSLALMACEGGDRELGVYSFDADGQGIVFDATHVYLGAYEAELEKNLITLGQKWHRYTSQCVSMGVDALSIKIANTQVRCGNFEYSFTELPNGGKKVSVFCLSGKNCPVENYRDAYLEYMVSKCGVDAIIFFPTSPEPQKFIYRRGPRLGGQDGGLTCAIEG